jgi:hypothetical protein
MIPNHRPAPSTIGPTISARVSSVTDWRFSSIHTNEPTLGRFIVSINRLTNGGHFGTFDLNPGSFNMRNQNQHRTSVYFILLVLAIALTGIIVWAMSAPITKSSWQASTAEDQRTGDNK